MRDRKVLMVDVDGVLADFTRGFLTLINTRCEYETPILSTKDQTDWHFDSIPLAVKQKAWSIIKTDPTFWFNLTGLCTRQESRDLNNLALLYDVYYVTSRIGLTAKVQTELWLRKHSITDPTVIVTGHSGLKGAIAKGLRADLAIDDDIRNVEDMSAMGTRAYMLTQGYNRTLNVRWRVSTVAEFIEVCKNVRT